MKLALSCAWNSRRHRHAKSIIKEIKELGFQEIELNFSLTPRIIKEIQSLVKKKEIKIKSVHNFCPIPDGLSIEEALPDCYSMSSLNEQERKRAIFYTKRTIDTAVALGAKAVVLHCGRNEIEDYTRKLLIIYQKGKKKSREFRRLRQKAIRERQAVKDRYFKQTLRSLQELEKYAAQKRIYLGIENRFYYREIPSLEEIEIILKEFKNSQIYFWFDTGHAKIMEDLDMADFKDYLELYARYIIGIHLHNVINGKDHQAPHIGEIDFREIRPYLKENTIKVIEAHFPQADSQDLKEAKAYLEEIFDG